MWYHRSSFSAHNLGIVRISDTTLDQPRKRWFFSACITCGFPFVKLNRDYHSSDVDTLKHVHSTTRAEEVMLGVGVDDYHIVLGSDGDCSKSLQQ